MDELADWLREYRESTSLERRYELAERIVEAILPQVHQFIRFPRCPEDAVEEVQQDALFAIASGLQEFKGTAEKQFWEWCYRIASRKSADVWRKRGRKPLLLVEPEELWRAVESSAEVEPLTPEERADLHATMELLRQAQPPCYDMLVQRYIADRSLQDIAAATGLTYDAARMRIERCLDAARELAREDT